MVGEDPRSSVTSRGRECLVQGKPCFFLFFGGLLSGNDGKNQVKGIYIYMYYICLDGECLMQQIFDGFELHWGPPINDGHKDKH